MHSFKVIGPGCNSCRTTAALIAEVAKARGIAIGLEEIHDPAQIAALGVMRTPAVMRNGMLIHTGGTPEWIEVEGWLTQIDNRKEAP